MSVQPIVDVLTKLTTFHHSLLEISKQKTDVLKTGDMSKLQMILIQERKHIQAINQMETKRQTLVETWASNHQYNDADMTVTRMLELITDQQEKDSLEQATVHLADCLVQLKQQEQLNQQLTQQSLQFIEFSLDMLNPTLKNLNYDNGKKSNQPQQNQQANRSMFDSKA